MSRELITNHPDIFHYTTIWMENITHVTKRGESEFGLSNTNKLLRHYQGATGLKTGSTSKAGFCLSATAERNHISLIAVIANVPSAKSRSRPVPLYLITASLSAKFTPINSLPHSPPSPYIMAQKNYAFCKYKKLLYVIGNQQITFRKESVPEKSLLN